MRLGRNGFQSLKAPNNNGNGESGAPYCARATAGGDGVDPNDHGRSSRPAHSLCPIINCLAQSGSVNNNGNVPVASFGKFFISQPMQADNTDNLYGEMVGLPAAAETRL